MPVSVLSQQCSQLLDPRKQRNANHRFDVKIQPMTCRFRYRAQNALPASASSGLRLSSSFVSVAPSLALPLSSSPSLTHTTSLRFVLFNGLLRQL